MTSRDELGAGAPVDPRGSAATTPVELSAAERFRRARRTGAAIAKVYLGYKGLSLLDRGRLHPLIRRARARWHHASARTLHDAAIDLGGLLLKAGQFLSTRTDILPPAYAAELSRLQDRVPAHPYRVVAGVIERELGAPPEQIFRHFWRRPIASASLAQVHRATLRDGRDVAVKVQRPEIEDKVRADLENLRVALKTLERLEGELGLRTLLDELEQNTPRELDFVREAESAERLHAAFANDESVVIPRPLRELVTRRVVVSEFVSGIKVTDLRRLERARIDREAVANLLTRAYLDQVFTHGFFHADPHPGNLLVVPHESGPRLAFVDFGLVAEVPSSFQDHLGRLVQGLLAGETDAVVDALSRLGFATRDSEARTIPAAATLLIEALRARTAGGDGERLRKLGGELARIVREDPLIRMPPYLFLLTRVIALLSGVSTTLGVRLELLHLLLPRLFTTK